MRKRLIVIIVVSWLATGCGAVGAVAHGYHRYSNPGEGMEPTIHRGQTFDARPVKGGRYEPRRGDVVVFTMPAWTPVPGRPLVKRVVAIGGDTIGCCSNGHVTLNGAPLSEPYLAPRTPESTFGPVTVPPGHLWLMGDNRPVSADSRYHFQDGDKGTVPASAVIGVAVRK
jgi:signal peptidase I